MDAFLSSNSNKIASKAFSCLLISSLFFLHLFNYSQYITLSSFFFSEFLVSTKACSFCIIYSNSIWQDLQKFSISAVSFKLLMVSSSFYSALIFQNSQFSSISLIFFKPRILQYNIQFLNCAFYQTPYSSNIDKWGQTFIIKSFCLFQLTSIQHYRLIIQLFVMIKRIKHNFFSNEVERMLEKAKVDSSHEFINPKYFSGIASFLATSKTKIQLLKVLQKNFLSHDNTLRTKSLIIVHSCLRKSFDEEICSLIMKIQIPNADAPSSKQEKQGMSTFIRKNVLSFYLVYLKKMVLHKDSYQFIKDFNRKQFLTDQDTTETEYTKHFENIEIVTNGFKILNLINYILQSQQMFNKMGRYHIEYQELISMQIQLIQDLNAFNMFIKMSVNAILKRNGKNKSLMSLESCYKFSKEIGDKIQDNNQNKIPNMFKKDKVLISSTTKPESIKQQEIESSFEKQEIKHQFLYINQSQKLSDRLYQFYHNRYYYKFVKNVISFPTFLVIEGKQYSQIKNKTKKIDRNLVNLVKKSKYDMDSSVNYDNSYKTDPGQNINSTFSYNQTNYTELNDNYKKQQTKIGSRFLNNYIQETVQNYEQI